MHCFRENDCLCELVVRKSDVLKHSYHVKSLAICLSTCLQLIIILVIIPSFSVAKSMVILQNWSASTLLRHRLQVVFHVAGLSDPRMRILPGDTPRNAILG